MVEYLKSWLLTQGMAESGVGPVAIGILIVGLAAVAAVSNYIARRILLKAVHMFVRKSRTSWDDALASRKVFTRLSHIAPAMVIYATAGIIPQFESFLQQISLVYMMLVGLFVWSAFLSATVDIYQTYEVSREKQIKGYIQVIKIVSSVLVAVFVVATLIERSPWMLLSGLGALSAVLLFIFKDSILGLIASIQLSANDMVRRGDWIEMPRYGADGDIIDVSLHTVKVQNWDKTITTIPSQALISESFKNWRGMEQSGGRRIKRAINIDMNSIKFCSKELLDRFERIQLLAKYITSRKEEIEKHNREKSIDSSTLVNGRRMTNVGTFRAYLVAYLKDHSKIHQKMTFLVRQLALPTAVCRLSYMFSAPFSPGWNTRISRPTFWTMFWRFCRNLNCVYSRTRADMIFET